MGKILNKIVIVVFSILVFTGFSQPAFAFDDFGIQDGLKNFSHYFWDWIDATNTNSNADAPTQEKYHVSIETSKEFTDLGIDWFFKGHEMIVNWIFAGSPIPIHTGIVVLIALAIMIFVLIKFGKDHLKHWFFIILGVGIFLMFIVVLGIKLSF